MAERHIPNVGDTTNSIDNAESDDAYRDFFIALNNYRSRVWRFFGLEVLMGSASATALFVTSVISAIGGPSGESEMHVMLDLHLNRSMTVLALLLTAVISLQVVWRFCQLQELRDVADRAQARLVARSYSYANLAQAIGVGATAIGVVSSLLNFGGADGLDFIAAVVPPAGGLIVAFLAADIAAGIDERLERQLQKAIAEGNQRAQLDALRAELDGPPERRDFIRWLIQLVSAVVVPSAVIAVGLYAAGLGGILVFILVVAVFCSVCACLASLAGAKARISVTIAARFVARFFELFSWVTVILTATSILVSLGTQVSTNAFAWLILGVGLTVTVVILIGVRLLTRARKERPLRVFDAVALLIEWHSAGKPSRGEIWPDIRNS